MYNYLDESIATTCQLLYGRANLSYVLGMQIMFWSRNSLAICTQHPVIDLF